MTHTGDPPEVSVGGSRQGPWLRKGGLHCCLHHYPQGLHLLFQPASHPEKPQWSQCRERLGRFRSGFNQHQMAELQEPSMGQIHQQNPTACQPYRYRLRLSSICCLRKDTPVMNPSSSVNLQLVHHDGAYGRLKSCVHGSRIRPRSQLRSLGRCKRPTLGQGTSFDV